MKAKSRAKNQGYSNLQREGRERNIRWAKRLSEQGVEFHRAADIIGVRRDTLMDYVRVLRHRGYEAFLDTDQKAPLQPAKHQTGLHGVSLPRGIEW